MSTLIGMTGKSGAGKTKAFHALALAAQEARLSVFGFYCPAVFKENEKIAINVCLLPGGKTYLFGSLEKHELWQPIGRWWMDPSIFTLVNEHLQKFVCCDLLLIDEIGPAEIEANMGWPQALDLLKRGQFQVGVISFRPAFIEYFKDNYPGIEVFNLDEGDQTALSNLLERFCKPNLPV